MLEHQAMSRSCKTFRLELQTQFQQTNIPRHLLPTSSCLYGILYFDHREISSLDVSEDHFAGAIKEGREGALTFN